MSTNQDKLAGLLAKKALIDGGNAAVDQHGTIVDRRENPKAVPVPPRSWLPLPTPKLKVLAIMQNQWLNNAAYHQNRFDLLRAEDKAKWRKLWQRTVAMALFAGCHTGRVLKKHLGEELIGRIVWDESTRVIGVKPSDCPPPDLEHVRETIDAAEPDVIFSLGKQAGAAVDAILDPGFSGKRTYKGRTLTFIQSPHPAARGAGMQESVREACTALRVTIGEYP